jgi:hypothetical protein
MKIGERMLKGKNFRGFSRSWIINDVRDGEFVEDVLLLGNGGKKTKKQRKIQGLLVGKSERVRDGNRGYSEMSEGFGKRGENFRNLGNVFEY